MTGMQDCLEALRGYIERADRNELAEAQAAIIQLALTNSDLNSRAGCMRELQEKLAEEFGSREQDPMQQAYCSVLDAMIDRTRDAMLS